MVRCNVQEGKCNHAGLLKEMAGGEKVVIMRDGKPVAELVPFREPRRKKRRLGFAAGEVWMADGWERPMTDEEADAFLDGAFGDIPPRHVYIPVDCYRAPQTVA